MRNNLVKLEEQMASTKRYRRFITAPHRTLKLIKVGRDDLNPSETYTFSCFLEFDASVWEPQTDSTEMNSTCANGQGSLNGIHISAKGNRNYMGACSWNC